MNLGPFCLLMGVEVGCEPWCDTRCTPRQDQDSRLSTGCARCLDGRKLCHQRYDWPSVVGAWAASRPAQSRRQTTLEWHPRHWSKPLICAFSVVVGDAVHLIIGAEHNANWIITHGGTFTLFRTQMIDDGLHHSWERVTAAGQLLRRREPPCEWVMHMDADAIVVDVARSPTPLLHQVLAEAAPATPAMITTCNSPLGRGLDCDIFCCGRAHQRPQRQRHSPGGRCTVGLQDEGPAAPFPCMINPAVFFLRNSPNGTALLQAWQAHQPTQRDTFGEQESLNLVKRRHPHLIEVIGGQVWPVMCSMI